MNIKLFESSDLTKCHTVATDRYNYTLPMYPNGTMESSNKIPFDLTMCHTIVEINRLKIALPMLLLLSCGQGNNQTKNTQQLEFQTKNTTEENKKDPQEIKSQRLKEAFENKNEALFLVEFPS